MVEGYFRGHLCWYDGSEWRYCDDDTIYDDSRPCPQCDQLPTPEGYDACIGHLPGAISVCCGHGVEDGYIIWQAKEYSSLVWEFELWGFRLSIGKTVKAEK